MCSDCHDQQHMLQISKIGKEHVWYNNLDSSVCSVSRHSLDLVQVLTLLGQDRACADPESADLCLGYSTMHMAIYAACVGSYLLDLLHMRHLNCSPMSAQDPDTFLMACQGTCSPGQLDGTHRLTFALNTWPSDRICR